MRKTREILLRFYHDPEYRFADVEICYVNRGAPGDRSCIGGDRIIRLDPTYIEIESGTGTTPIPYHRLIRILYQGNTAWERGRPAETSPGSVEKREGR
ncbi:MAG: RNA repair domain-containing protein [Methanoregulaceae archaeon]|nr:RNA repair domain-containing protein [Methanoregulaceae archaeon]